MSINSFTVQRKKLCFLSSTSCKNKKKEHPQSVHVSLPWFQHSVGQPALPSVLSFICAFELLYRITDVTTSEKKYNVMCVFSSFRRVFFFFSSVLSKPSSGARRAAKSQEASTVLPASLFVFCCFFTSLKNKKGSRVLLHGSLTEDGSVL